MKPLAGIKVVELARILAGPWCGQLLADLGAEVIKVERPGKGDDTRHWGPPFVEGKDGENLDAAYYHATNRGKTNVAIDISSVKGQEEVRELVRASDVLIENYKVGGLVKYGLDHKSLSIVHPQLITCSITGFGQTGPYAYRAGYDFVAQGISGFMSLNGEPEGEPQKAGVAYADIFTGVYSAVAILTALRSRDVTGRGAHIDMELHRAIEALAPWRRIDAATARLGGEGRREYARVERIGDGVVDVRDGGQHLIIFVRPPRHHVPAESHGRTDPELRICERWADDGGGGKTMESGNTADKRPQPRLSREPLGEVLVRKGKVVLSTHAAIGRTVSRAAFQCHGRSSSQRDAGQSFWIFSMTSAI